MLAKRLEVRHLDPIDPLDQIALAQGPVAERILNIGDKARRIDFFYDQAL